MRDIAALPADLTRLLFDLGPRKLVLVEGPSDRDVFHVWYRDRLSELGFYPAGGDQSVESYLATILAYSTTQRAYGITDRDFRTDEEVQNPLNDPDAHLFILRRYAIENYLLEPHAVWQHLRLFQGEAFAVVDAVEMSNRLLALCRELHTMMAANWLLHEASAELFPEGYDLLSRDDMIAHTANRLHLDVAQTEPLVAAKEAAIGPLLVSLDDAYTRINGKHLLHQIVTRHRVPHRPGLQKEHFLRLLADTVQRNPGMHADIATIVEQRILGNP